MEGKDSIRCRCMLITPATRPDRFHNAVKAGADGIVIDLEDAVPLSQKDAAREQVIHFLKDKGKLKADHPFLTGVRINNIHTLAGLKDLSALAESGVCPDIVVLPKVESPVEVDIASENLTGVQRGIQFIAAVETARGLQQAHGIASAGSRLAAISFGGADLASDLGAVFGWETMLFARSRLVQAAATAGIPALDVPFLDVRNTLGLGEECDRIRNLGYSGKFAIHPDHVAPILAAFTPDASAVEQATRIVRAYEETKGSVCEVDGKMVDVPVYNAAKRTLVLSEKRSG